MPIDIPEKDWKIFRRLREAALERFCERVLGEAEQVIADRSGSASMLDRYHKLYKLIHDRDKDLGSAFDNPRRSQAMWQIAILCNMGLFTDDELAEFTPETQNYIKALSRWRE